MDTKFREIKLSSDINHLFPFVDAMDESKVYGMDKDSWIYLDITTKNKDILSIEKLSDEFYVKVYRLEKIPFKDEYEKSPDNPVKFCINAIRRIKWV